MRFKLDENLNESAKAILRNAGHDVMTAVEQELAGSADPALFKVCQAELRCLVTLDLDFANLLDFPPNKSAGIVVLRHRRPTLAGVSVLVQQLATALKSSDPTGKLWIIEPGHLRIHD